MDGTQATQIRTLLLEAADSIDRASAIISTLDSEDRAMISTALDEISSALRFELLQKIYLRFPALQPVKQPNHQTSRKTSSPKAGTDNDRAHLADHAQAPALATSTFSPAADTMTLTSASSAMADAARNNICRSRLHL